MSCDRYNCTHVGHAEAWSATGSILQGQQTHCLGHHHAALQPAICNLQGVDLLNLPEEILQNVARYFTLAEWIQGPAQACCLLYWLKLTRVDLNCHRVEERVQSNLK